jgi:hypothetical protein
MTPIGSKQRKRPIPGGDYLILTYLRRTRGRGSPANTLPNLSAVPNSAPLPVVVRIAALIRMKYPPAARASILIPLDPGLSHVQLRVEDINEVFVVHGEGQSLGIPNWCHVARLAHPGRRFVSRWPIAHEHAPFIHADAMRHRNSPAHIRSSPRP